MSFHNHTVDWNFFARLYNNHRADLHFIRVYFFNLTVCFNICIIRPDIHQITDIPAALTDCITLEQLSDLIKQHNCNAFFVIAEGNRSDGCHCHQEIFIKHLPVTDSFPGFPQNIIADHKIRNQIEKKLQPLWYGNNASCNPDDNQKHCRHNNSFQYFFLLFIHGALQSD